MARQQANTEVVFPGTETSLPLDALKATIAMELAAGLTTADGVKERYGISEAQWSILRRTPVFRNMLKEAIEKLAGDTNAGARIKLKSDVLLEDNLGVLDEIANDKDAQSQARIEAIKTMAQLAGRTQKEVTQGGGAGAFNLQIVIGEQAVNVTGVASKPPLEHQPDE